MYICHILGSDHILYHYKIFTQNKVSNILEVSYKVNSFLNIIGSITTLKQYNTIFSIFWVYIL